MKHEWILLKVECKYIFNGDSKGERYVILNVIEMLFFKYYEFTKVLYVLYNNKQFYKSWRPAPSIRWYIVITQIFKSLNIAKLSII